MNNLKFFQIKVSKDINVFKKSLNINIFFGEVGSGKTTLVNQLCQKKLETTEGGYSCTTNIFNTKNEKTSEKKIINRLSRLKCY